MTATFDDAYGTMYPAFSITDFVKISPDFFDLFHSVPIAWVNVRACCRNCLASIPCADVSCLVKRLSFCTHKCDACDIGGCACPPGRTGCECKCCGEGKVCTTDGCCSPNQVCNNRCCPPGWSCNGSFGCCPPGVECCGPTACPPGNFCCGEICCPDSMFCISVPFRPEPGSFGAGWDLRCVTKSEGDRLGWGRPVGF
jgi:hypothetical protein